MIIDIFGSLKDNFIRRVRNPFFGTLTVVLLLQNWKLFYSLFCFDGGDNRIARIDILEQYILGVGGYWWIVSNAVWWTLCVMIGSYILLNLSAYLAHVSDGIVHPWVVKLASRGARIVTKEKYDQLDRKYADLEEKFDDERNKRRAAEDEQKRLEGEMSSLRQLRNPKGEVAPQIITNIVSNSFARAIAEEIANLGHSKAFKSLIMAQKENAYVQVPTKGAFADFVAKNQLVEPLGSSPMERQFTPLGKMVIAEFRG